jgi:nitrogen fixation/metabolism regulation signal transduction histidine kinase
LINGIEGGMYFVSSGMKKGKQERVGQGHDMMKRNLDRIRRTVASILYYVKDREINWTELSIQGVVSSVVKAMEDRAGHLGVTMEIQAEDGTFEGDEFAVNSMLLNVVDYALEVCHRAQKENAASLVGSARVYEGWATFDLCAEGFPMEEESRQLALAPYYAPRGVDRSHLPLFIANRILRNHLGTLEIKVSADPPSTRFLIKVPTTRAAD